MIAALLVALLSVLALAWVLSPLRRGPRRDLPQHRSLLDDAIRAKNEALDAIVDLERDRDAGKLTDEDLEALSSEQAARALAALEEIDALQGSVRADDEIEAEIAAARDRLACPACGATRGGRGPCPRCGAS
jgi:cytochrome c-type biogenesis protein CcmH/NrfG